MRYRFTLNSAELGAFILTKSPRGFDKMEIVVKRGPEYHGFFYEQITKLEFFCNGAGKEYIDEFRETYGIDGIINIAIEVACGGGVREDSLDYSLDYSDDYGSEAYGGVEWEEFYTGILDLKTWETLEGVTKVDIIQSDFFQKVRNRLDTKVDLFGLESLDGTALSAFTYGPYDLNLHSKALLLQGRLTMFEPSVTPLMYLPATLDTMYVTLPFDYIEYDELSGLLHSSATITSNAASLSPDPVYTNNSGQTETVELTYDFVGTLTDIIAWDRFYTLQLVYRIGPSFTGYTTIATLADYGSKNIISSVAMTQAVNEQGTISVNVPNGNSLYLSFVLANYDNDPSSPKNAFITLDFTTCQLDFKNVSTTPATTGQAFAKFEAGAQIARTITDQLDSFRSNYFGRLNSEPYAYDVNGCGAFGAFLNGFMVRGFPVTGDNARTIRLSMNDYFKGLSAIENLGLGVEEVGGVYYVVVEPREYFYDVSATILTLSNVPDIKRYELPEYYYNRVKVGYNKWETEFINGLDEINSQRQYDTKIKAVDNELTLISELVASGYRLEAARRNQYSDSFTEDSEYDEDNFYVALNRTVDGSNIPTSLDVCEKDENFDQVNNILSPETSYNLRLSPARNYLRHNNIVNAGLTKYAGREVKFTSGEGNYKVESELTNDVCPGRWNNEPFSENQDVQWDHVNNSDKDPIWLPEGADCKWPISRTQHNLIMANPKGVIELSDSAIGHVKYFILEYKFKPDAMSEFKLLRAYE